MTRSPHRALEPISPASAACGDAHEPSAGCAPSITGRPTWIRTEDDPEGALAAWVHASGRFVRGILILAAPIGREHVISYRTVRTLCCLAAERGLLAVRFDWTGHGDSREWRPGANLAERWVSDLEAVIQEARRAAPGVPVTVLGVRLGGTVAAASRWAEATSEHRQQAGVDLVAWAPVSGRHYLREQTALRRISVPDVPPVPRRDGVEINGDLLDPDQAASVQDLRLSKAESVQVVEARPGDELAWSAAFRYAQVPRVSIQLILDAMSLSDSGREMHWNLRRRAEQPVQGGSAERVAETWTATGEHGLWGVLSEALHQQPDRSVVLVAPDAEPRHGPSRLWARVSRPLAQAGCSVLRADRRGTGDNADPRSFSEPNPYTEDTVEDVQEALRAQRDRTNGPLTAVGLCAGAWAAARAAGRTRIDDLVLINNAAWSFDPRSYRRLYQDSPITAALGGGTKLSGRPDSARARIHRGLKSVHLRLQIDAPRPMRRAVQRWGLLEDAAGLLPPDLEASQVSVWSCLGDLRVLAQAGGRGALRRWRRRGPAVQVRPLAAADHALLSARARAEVAAVLMAHLCLRPEEPQGQ